MITEKQFQNYECIRTSGITNMANIGDVADISGLEEEDIREIMRDYIALKEKYSPDGKGCGK